MFHGGARACCLAAFLLAGLVAGGAVREDPVAKALVLLTDLQAKVIKEGEKAQFEYRSYAEWCEERYKDLSYEIQTGKAQKAGLEATITKEASNIMAYTAKIEEIASGVATQKADLEAATKLRTEEASTFSAEEKELVDIVDTLERAIRIIDREMKKGSASMLQFQRMPDILKAFDAMVQVSVIDSTDAKKLAALVQDSRSSENADDSDPGAPAAATYASHSAGILDTLEGLLDKATEQLDGLRKTETAALHNFEMLKQGLEDEIKFGSKDMAAAKQGLAASTETKSVAEGDLEVTNKDLESDVKELADVHHSCQTTAEDFEATTKSRADELSALAAAKEAIAEMTGGAQSITYGLAQTSFLQYRLHRDANDLSNFAVVRFVRNLARKQGSTALAQLANRMASTIRFNTRTGQDPFAKVKGLIMDLITSLENAADTDASHKAYCDKEMSETAAKKEDKAAEIAKLSTAIDKMSSRIAQLEEEVATLTHELASLAESQAAYDKWFQEVEATFTANKADMEEGIEGVKLALKVLKEYYAKDSSHAAATGAADGIVGLLEVVESDFTKGLAEATAAFANDEREHKDFTFENQIVTAAKNQDVKYKGAELTKLRKALGEATADRKGVQAEMDAVLSYQIKINEICVAKAEPYAERAARREAEIAGLKQALEVLQGEAVLLQTQVASKAPSAPSGLRGVRPH